MRLPLASDLLSRDGSLTKDARLTNCFVEAKGEKSAVVSRPGLEQKFDLTAGNGNGMVAWKGTLYAVRGNTVTQGPSQNITDGSLWTKTLDTTGPADSGRFAYDETNDVAWCVAPDGTTGIPKIYKSISKGDLSFVSTATSIGWHAEPGVVFHSNKLWILGGLSGGSTFHNDVWNSSDGTTWTQVTASASWSGRKNPRVLSFGGSIWLYGGGKSGGVTDTETWSSSDGITWTKKSNSPGATVAGYALIEHNSEIFLIGRNTSTNKTVVYSTPDGVTWTLVCSDVGVDAEYAGIASHAGKMWLVGAGASKREVWSSSTGATWAAAVTTAAFPSGVYVRDAISDGESLYTPPTVSAKSWWKATNNQPGGYSYTVADFPTNFTSTSDAAATDYLFLKNNTDAWVLTFGSPGTLTQVTDADYPATTVPGCAYLDGYIFVMDEAGTIYNSALEDPLSWNSLDYLTAESEPDAGVALVKHNNYIVALKSTSIEAFYDAANPSGSPLAPVSNSPYKIGCANGWSVAEVDGKVFFLSQTNSQGKSVHFFPSESVTPTEAATEDVKRILASSELATVRAFAMRMSGHTFYVLNLLSDGVSLVYDLTTGLWATWTYRAAASPITLTSLTQADGIATATKTNHGFSDGDLITHAGATPSGYNVTENITVIDANTYTFPVSSALTSPATGTITATGTTETHFPFSAFCSAGGVDYIQHEDSGIIYEISPAYTTDDGQYIDVHVRLPKFDGGDAQRKTIGTLEIIGDKVSANALVRWSDDDYATYSKYRRVNLGNERSRINRLGSFSRRAFELRFTDDAQMRLSEIEI